MNGHGSGGASGPWKVGTGKPHHVRSVWTNFGEGPGWVLWTGMGAVGVRAVESWYRKYASCAFCVDTLECMDRNWAVLEERAQRTTDVAFRQSLFIWVMSTLARSESPRSHSA
jgi:hypothetical protein